jgi:glycosyltransferase involved in cell wall biosynthesis
VGIGSSAVVGGPVGGVAGALVAADRWGRVVVGRAVVGLVDAAGRSPWARSPPSAPPDPPDAQPVAADAASATVDIHAHAPAGLLRAHARIAMTSLPLILPGPVTPRLTLVRPHHDGDAESTARRSSDVVLVTEGTYPHAHGGVSVWCDQLVTGLPEQRFRLVALTAFSYQRPVWNLPGHVDELTTVGLWDGARHRPRPPRRPAAPLAASLAALLTRPDEEVGGFVQWVDDLGRYDAAEIARQLTFGELVVALDAALAGPGTWPIARRARASDLVKVADMLDHLLRPLTIDAGPAAVYHASSNGLAALVCLLAHRRHGARFLLTEHGIYLRERYLELRRMAIAQPAKALLLRFHRLVSCAAYREAAVIAPGSGWNQRWEIRNGARPHRVRTVYNGIDPAAFAAREVEPDEPVVSWLGRIDPIKDIETLVQGFAVVNAKRPDARLRLYGRIPATAAAYKGRIDALIDELGLVDVVTFEGGVAESADAYRDAQLGVLSSISEGFPYSLIEAMACGLPAVATGVGGVAEAVADTGIVVPPRAPEMLGEAIVELLDDGPRRRRMGVLARERVLEHFTLEVCLEGFREIYADLKAMWPPLVRVVGGRAAAVEVVVGAGAGSGGGSGSGGRDGTDGGALSAEQDGELVAALGGADALAMAVDVDEVAATLESVGVTDQVAQLRFATPDVFRLAEHVWSTVGPGAADAGVVGGGGGGGEGPPRPPRTGPARPKGVLARGMAYVLPAAVVAASVIGGADEKILLAASMAGWGLGQAGGVLAYTAFYRSPTRSLGPLRRGLQWSVIATLLMATGLGLWRGAGSGVAFALPLLHLVGATSLVMTSRTRALLLLLLPVSALSVGAVLFPRSPVLPLVGPAAVATVVATLSLVAVAVRRAPAGPSGPLLERSDWVASAPLVVCGWLSAAFALLAVSATGQLPDFVQVDSRQWLIVGLPLWVMVAASEWLLLSVRRALAAELEAGTSLAVFRAAALRAAGRSLAIGALAMVAAVGAGAGSAVALSDLSPGSALVAATVFGLVASALYGTTVLSAGARTGSVIAAMAVAAAGLAAAVFLPGGLLGLPDHVVALAVGGAAAAVLCADATRALVDPASLR